MTNSLNRAHSTSRNIINNARLVGDAIRLSPDDMVCCPPPLFHCFGLVLGFLAAFTHGSCIVFPSDAFNADSTLNAIYSEKATVLLGVPTMFLAELEQLERTGRKPTTLRVGLAAGSSVPMALIKALNDKMGMSDILIGYGMTETSPISFITSIDDTLEKKLKTVGRVLPHVRAKVVDKNGNILQRGQKGELCTSGPFLQKGYWKNPEKTTEVMIKGSDGRTWMHTGDEAFIDDEGYAHITGRIKDMIIRGEILRPLNICYLN